MNGETRDRARANDDLARRSVRGALTSVLGQAANFILRIGSMMVIARLVTPEHFGLVTMVTAFTGMLGLFRDEVAEVPAAASPPAREDNACPDGAPPAAVAQSSPSEPPPEDPRARAENDPDLRLQPDDDDRRAGAGPDAGS